MTQTDDPVDTADDPVGTVAEEAAKLLGALSGWAREQGDGLQDGLTHGMSNLADGLHEHVATGSAECTWCPVCRTVAAVRHASPEVKAHLTTAASSLALAVSGLLATRPDGGRGGRSGVERIRLDDEAGDEGDRHPADDPADDGITVRVNDRADRADRVTDRADAADDWSDDWSDWADEDAES